MRGFHDWLQRQIAAAVEPQLLQTTADLQRALEDATSAVQRSLRHETDAARADITTFRRDNERTRAELLVALERIGDEIDASHATVRGLVARMRALEVARTSRSSTQVLGGTIDVTTDDAATPVTPS